MQSQGASARLSPQEADTVEAVAAFHRDHYKDRTPSQALVDHITAALARPAALAIALLIIIVGLGVAAVRGDGAFVRAAAVLEAVATVVALVVSMIILITQSRERDLAERRAQLTLELALLADRKNAKIITLLKDLRRDAPGMADRPDAESTAMSAPANLGAVADALEDADDR